MNPKRQMARLTFGVQKSICGLSRRASGFSIEFASKYFAVLSVIVVLKNAKPRSVSKGDALPFEWCLTRKLHGDMFEERVSK